MNVLRGRVGGSALALEPRFVFWGDLLIEAVASGLDLVSAGFSKSSKDSIGSDSARYFKASNSWTACSLESGGEPHVKREVKLKVLV